MSAHEKYRESALNSPLLTAIADLRSDVNRLFEEHKVLIQGQDSDLGLAPISRLATQTTPVVATSPPVTHAQPPAAAEVECTPPVRGVNARSKDAQVKSSLIEPPLEESAAGGRPEDSRQRLDALAKLLDKRLKPTGTPARAGDS